MIISPYIFQRVRVNIKQTWSLMCEHFITTDQDLHIIIHAMNNQSHE